MSNQTEALLEAFEHLPAEERRVFAQEILRRSLPFESGDLTDQDIAAASSNLFKTLDQEDADPPSR
jgi:hypothetical protein